MKLEAFFRQVAPLLEGRVPVAQGTRRLFPHPSVDSRRLAIYARFCRVHRSQALAVFTYTRDAIIARAGEEAWLDLVERTFRAHPMHHFEMNENGAPFPAFLPSQLKRLKLEPFWAELADFEWWEWRTRSTLDEASDRHDRGPLRLAGTVELRPYTRRWVHWIDTSERSGEPEAGAEVVVFWRNRDLRPRREVTTPTELSLLKSIYDGQGDPAALAPTDELRECLDDLRDAGIVRGGRAE